MLVLSRKTGEKLHVGDNVVIEVRRVSGCRVSIAIEAPREVKILRGEIVDAVAEFEEPADRSGEMTVTPVSVSVPTCEPVPDSMQVEPYLLSHPPINPPGSVPGW
jgi:carbon storage regulator CsrA